MELYLTTLLPPPDVAGLERRLKEEIAARYQTRVAVTKPAHITIIPPFRAGDEKLEAVCSLYTQVCSRVGPFPVKLDGIGCFEKNRVVYIHVNPLPEADALYRELKRHFLSSGLFPPSLLPREKLTPHMTLAYRDLTPESFRAIWSAYRDHPFTAVFTASSLHLMKYVNRRWVPYREFPFGVTNPA